MIVRKKNQVKSSISAGSTAGVVVDKQKEIKTEPAEIKTEKTKTEEIKAEPIVPLDVAIQTAIPQPVKTSPATATGPANPLDDFKVKVEEELGMQSKPQKNYMWPILFIFIVATLFLVGVFAYKQGIFKIEKTDIASLIPTPAAASLPSPAPAKAVDLTKYEIEVLNGSEVSGEASRQKDSLEEKGFTVSSIGNAENSDYTDTIIKAKADVDSDFVTELKNFLSNTFTVGKTQILPDDSSAPVVVILGTKK